MLECVLKMYLLRFTCNFAFLKIIAFSAKSNISCLALFQSTTCMAMGPGQDMLDSTQIIGRTLYQKAKVSWASHLFHLHLKLLLKIYQRCSLGS